MNSLVISTNHNTHVFSLESIHSVEFFCMSGSRIALKIYCGDKIHDVVTGSKKDHISDLLFIRILKDSKFSHFSFKDHGESIRAIAYWIAVVASGLDYEDCQ